MSSDIGVGEYHLQLIRHIVYFRPGNDVGRCDAQCVVSACADNHAEAEHFADDSDEEDYDGDVSVLVSSDLEPIAFVDDRSPRLTQEEKDILCPGFEDMWFNFPLPFNSVRFLTTAIVAEMSYSQGLHRQVLFTIGLVLFVFIMIINVSLTRLFKKGEAEND